MNGLQSATADMVMSTAVAGETEDHELFLGQFIAKDFNSPFEGEVSVTPDQAFNYYRIIYEDGDDEHLTYNQVKRYVALLPSGNRRRCPKKKEI